MLEKEGPRQAKETTETQIETLKVPRVSKYAKISMAEELRLGQTITEIRTAAQAEADAFLEAKDPDEALKERERMQIWNKTWKERARSNPDFVEARDALALGYDDLGYAVSRHNRYVNLEDDLHQVTREHLLTTAEKYDPGKNTGFGSYVYGELQGAVSGVIRDADVVSSTRDTYREMKKVIKVEDSLAQELHRMPTAQEIADRLKDEEIAISKKKVEVFLFSDALKMPLPIVQEGDTEIDFETEEDPEDKDTYFAPNEKALWNFHDRALDYPVIEEQEIVDPNVDVEKAALDKEEVDTLIVNSALNLRQQYVVKAVYGYDVPLNEVGSELGISKQAVWQIEKAGLKRLAQVKETGITLSPTKKIDPYLKVLDERVRKQIGEGVYDKAEIANALGLDNKDVTRALARLRKDAINAAKQNREDTKPAETPASEPTIKETLEQYGFEEE
jgi:RNA polymerase sigma factor (sigma-70 family)